MNKVAENTAKKFNKLMSQKAEDYADDIIENIYNVFEPEEQKIISLQIFCSSKSAQNIRQFIIDAYIKGSFVGAINTAQDYNKSLHEAMGIIRI